MSPSSLRSTITTPIYPDISSCLEINKTKKAIIIGASSGIGKGLAKILAANNYNVGITGRRNHLLAEMKNENTNHFCIQPFDITQTEIIDQQLTELVTKLNGLDLLIICSGIGEEKESIDFSIEKNTINTNIIGFTAVINWSYHYFEKQKSGHLVAISSIAGIRGNRIGLLYSATKSYQINYLEGLRQKTNKSKIPILITDIRPGFVDTKMAKGDYLFWVSTVEKASEQIYKAILRKKKIAYITKRWIIIALALKIIPSPIYVRL